MIDYLYSLILGVIEGLTEFLPISSTGHLIVATAALHFPTAALNVSDPKAFADTFDIFIQLGAILAVMAFYSRDLIGQARRLPRDRATQRFWLNIVIASIPAGVVGFVLRDVITQALYTPVVVGIALVVGGVVLLLVERRPLPVRVTMPEHITTPQALLIGLAQMTALIPGVSRAAASIVGGMLTGLDRKTATSFSFYLAMPLLGAATVYQLFSELRKGLLDFSHLPVFLLGAGAAFVVAWVVVGWLLRYVASRDFRPFGWYRIIAGALILLLALTTTLFTR